MRKLFKILFPVVIIAFMSVACGEDPEQSLETDLNSIDLSVDTVQMVVDLPVVGGSKTNWGVKTESHALPMSLNDIKNIRLIAIDAQGKRHLIGRVTAKNSTKLNQINNLSAGDVIWISDQQDESLYIAKVEFSSGNQIQITVDLQTNGGSPSVADIYQQGQTTMRFYFHFERR